MRELFADYLTNLYNIVPMFVYEGLISVLCSGVILTLAFYGIKKGGRYIMRLLLVEYVILIFCSTILFRITSESQGYDFHPYWSYRAIAEGREELIPENVMNVVVFIPIGLLLGIAFKQMTWWKALMIGCGISIIIESLQFFLMRGFSEVDDVMHNTLGCLLGYGIMTILRIIFNTRYNNV